MPKGQKPGASPNIFDVGRLAMGCSRGQNQSLAQRFLNNRLKITQNVVIEIGAGVHIPTVRNESEYIAKEFKWISN